MAGRETYYNPNERKVESRETKSQEDVESAKDSEKFDPRATQRKADRPGGPKREDFPAGSAGDIPFATAVRSYQKKQKAQTQALSSMP